MALYNEYPAVALDATKGYRHFEFCSLNFELTLKFYTPVQCRLRNGLSGKVDQALIGFG